jgi:hypothetical protein
MAPDSLIPTPTDGQQTGGAKAPVADLISQIEQDMTRIELESKNLREQAKGLENQATQKDQQVAAIRVQLAKLSGAQAQTVKTPQIGEKIEGKGIYMGVYAPKYRNGKSLGKTFAVYVATEDLTDESGAKLVATFQDHAKRMTALKGWHGHDGFDSTNDAAITQGLADRSAVGKWLIPTIEILVGTDRNGDKVQDDNLIAHKDKLGAITTSRKCCGDYEYPNYYVSSTEPRDLSYGVRCARPADGGDRWVNRDHNLMSCRPVRVETLTL